MTQGPFLYDDSPLELHTGAPRQRHGLIIALLLGTVLVAVAMVGATVLVRGSSSDQAEQAASVFSRALAAGDPGTAYDLLCDDLRAQTTADQLPATYQRAGTPAVAGSTGTGADDGSQVVTVRWTDGTTVADIGLIVVAEGGGKVCGTAG